MAGVTPEIAAKLVELESQERERQARESAVALKDYKSDEANPKDALGLRKPPLDLVPAAGIIHESMAMKNGAINYGPYNWRKKKVKAMVYLAAAERHLARLRDGEDYETDPRTNIRVHHAGAARACLGIYLDAMETGNLIDDRPPPGPASKLIERFTEKT